MDPIKDSSEEREGRTRAKKVTNNTQTKKKVDRAISAETPRGGRFRNYKKNTKKPSNSQGSKTKRSVDSKGKRRFSSKNRGNGSKDGSKGSKADKQGQSSGELGTESKGSRSRSSLRRSIKFVKKAVKTRGEIDEAKVIHLLTCVFFFIEMVLGNGHSRATGWLPLGKVFF